MTWMCCITSHHHRTQLSITTIKVYFPTQKKRSKNSLMKLANTSNFPKETYKDNNARYLLFICQVQEKKNVNRELYRETQLFSLHFIATLILLRQEKKYPVFKITHSAERDDNIFVVGLTMIPNSYGTAYSLKFMSNQTMVFICNATSNLYCMFYLQIRSYI